MTDRSAALAGIAFDVLERLVREILARKPGAHLVEGSLDRLVLRLPLVLRGPGVGPAELAAGLVADVERLVDDAIQHAAAFRPGHAYCYRCGSAPCEHSAAPSHRHVFVGYAPTGQPRWEDFAQRCLDLRHPQVDRLYDDPPVFVTLVGAGEALNAPLLEAFRAEHAYRLCGQVAAGFFPLRAREGEGRGILAVTFQVGASSSRDGTARYGMNVLGRTPQGEPLDLLWERHELIPWQGAVRWAQAACGTLGRGRGRRASPERIDGILRGLARRLAHERRAAGRRTRHADARHLAGERPTRSALADARAVAPEEILVDERHHTLVVPGERGRMHFYTADGKLVSSVRYSKDAIARKRKTGTWRAAAPEEAAALIARLTPLPSP
jgi:hypothetical protein